MESWDQEKLESVVHEKHNRENQNNPTEIVIHPACFYAHASYY